ncbi:hypothetical protein CJ010_19245 [Azoarcus sp. DD4]|uniref:hypothetical protein n=1 Tax=Azoarcus sp. DD4 TaxID=2027405 RepID=UPI00112C6662|nr:hypothetical protein [Azoarcus sp. DD4]QDF98520.1 hypothetical protein CJ010_19245 [Azoarcus sp. DD4]
MFSKMLTGLMAVTLSLLAGSALAGPDWAAIERARAERKAQATAKPALEVAEQKVLPVNHGPRAEFRPVSAAPEASVVAPTSVARQ